MLFCTRFVTSYILCNTFLKIYIYIPFLDIDDCAPNPCQNGGTCTDGVDSYNCTCVAGFIGINCGTSEFCVVFTFIAILTCKGDPISLNPRSLGEKIVTRSLDGGRGAIGPPLLPTINAIHPSS